MSKYGTIDHGDLCRTVKKTYGDVPVGTLVHVRHAEVRGPVYQNVYHATVPGKPGLREFFLNELQLAEDARED